MNVGEGGVEKRHGDMTASATAAPTVQASELARLHPGLAGECARIEAVLFAGDDPWPEAAFVSELTNPSNFYVGAFTEPAAAGRLLGYGGITKLGPSGAAEYEIHTIGVTPEAQGQGLGRRIMDALMAAVAEDPGPVYLEVRTDNEPAIALYESFGFERMGVRKRYYQASGADAYTMCRAAE